MPTELVNPNHAIQLAKRGRRYFLGVVAAAAASGPVTAYLCGFFEWPVLLSGCGLAAVALAVGLPIFNNEIRRWQHQLSSSKPFPTTDILEDDKSPAD